MAIFYSIFYPIYIKKKDVKELIKFQQKLKALIIITPVVVVGIIQWLVIPKVFSMFIDFKIPVPFAVQISQYVALAAILLAFILVVYFLTDKAKDISLTKKLKKYKDNDLIRTKELINIKQELIWLSPTLLMIIWLIYSMIIPIYNLYTYFNN